MLSLDLKPHDRPSLLNYALVIKMVIIRFSTSSGHISSLTQHVKTMRLQPKCDEFVSQYIRQLYCQLSNLLRLG